MENRHANNNREAKDKELKELMEAAQREAEEDVNEDEIPEVQFIIWPTPAPPQGQTVCGFTWVVEPGDTVFFIARRFGSTVSAIAQANNLANPNLIFPGQRLIIPVLVYTVKPGDSLFLLGQQFGVTVQALAKANRLSPPFTIFVGQQLVIPRPCQLAPPPPPPPEEPCGVIYVVRPTDTVSLIASLFNVSTQSIIDANNLTPPFTIFPDQRLIIPVQAIVYQVRAGDTLAALATRFSSSVAVIARFNNIPDPNVITVGMWLTIFSPCTL